LPDDINICVNMIKVLPTSEYQCLVISDAQIPTFCKV